MSGQSIWIPIARAVPLEGLEDISCTPAEEVTVSWLLATKEGSSKETGRAAMTLPLSDSSLRHRIDAPQLISVQSVRRT